MEQYELLRHLVRSLEALKIPYLLTGAIASIAYGEPRFTNDIDVVADIQEGDIPGLRECFPETEFFLDEDAIKDAICHCHQFNIIHPSSGLKIDVIAPKGDAFDRSRFTRVKRLRLTEDSEANFASPEDVIIKKMQYYKEGGSEKHLRDITGILKISGELVDYNYTTQWADRLGVSEVWEAVLKRVKDRGRQ